MRTKSRGSRTRAQWFSKSRSPPNPSTASRPLPLFHLDDANPEDSLHSIELETLSESDDGLNNDGMEVDWLEGEACIKCNRGGGQVLVCTETGCPVSLHEKCMQCKPKFDDVGKFYCPYCWYKRELARTQELRKKAMLAKKALSDFLDLKIVGGNEENQNAAIVKGNESDMLPVTAAQKCSNHNNGMGVDELHSQPVPVEEGQQSGWDNVKPTDHDQCGIVIEHKKDLLPPVVDNGNDVYHVESGKTQGIKPLDASISKEESDDENNSETIESGNVEDREAKELRCFDDGQCEEDADKEQLEGPSNACFIEEKTIADGSLNVLTKVKCDIASTSKENQGRMEEEEQEHAKDLRTTESSTRDGTSQKVLSSARLVFDMSDSDTEGLSVRQKRIKQRKQKKTCPQNVKPLKKSSPQPYTSAEKNARTKTNGVTSSKMSRQPIESAKQFKKLASANEKRKRFRWTPEEEEMLKEGVQAFSTTVNKNLPWRKILEFGRHVFDSTRTPSDLKDKWRNIVAKRYS